MVLVPQTETYSISFHDCSTPQAVKQIDYSDACTPDTNQPEERQKLMILQEAKITYRAGFHCSAKVSRWRYLCGVWGHLKALSIPEILIPVTLTEAQCREMTRTMKFRPGTSTTYPLDLNKLTIIPLTEQGVLKLDAGKISCQGLKMLYKGELFDNSLIMAEYHILIRQTEFAVKGKTVEVDSEHLMLPCPAQARACQTGEGTWIWDPPKSTCPLRRVRQIQPVRTPNGLLFDEENKLVLNATEKTIMPGCGTMKLYKTNLEGIYLSSTEEARALEPINPHEVRLHLEMEGMGDYLMYRMETLQMELQGERLVQDCNHRWSHEEGTPVQLHHDLFGLLRGQVLYLFKCPNKVGQIAELKQCHEGIPIKSEPNLFVDPQTLIASKHSPVTSCSRRFPLRVKANEAWVEITPQVKQAPAPAAGQHILNPTIAHTQLENGGIYTEQELTEFEDVQAFPKYHQALLRAITLGSCKVTQDCGDSMQNTQLSSYDLTKLLHNQMENLSLWTMIDSWLTRHGAYLSALVILLTLCNWCINITTIMVSLIREGTTATIAVLAAIFCHGPRSMQNISRRNRRARAREDRTAETFPREERLRQADLIPMIQY